MSLSDKLFALASFKRQFAALLHYTVSSSLPLTSETVPREELLAAIDWNNMLSISSVLQQSEKVDHLDAALRVAQSALHAPVTEHQKAAAAVIREGMTNIPAIKLAIARGWLSADYRQQLPLPFLLQATKSNFEHSVIIKDQLILLNRFQKDVFLAHKSFDAVSISAPTSAGKSFILYNVLVDALAHSAATIIYVVPTRALISQVEEELRVLIATVGLKEVDISTVPQTDGVFASRIFVFTQERLHWFLSENTDAKIDMIVIDEAQKIDDGNRGILLQQKIEEVLKAKSDIKIFFSSPFTSNPEILLDESTPSSRRTVVNTQFVAVNQNLLYLHQVSRKVDTYTVDLVLPDRVQTLGTIKLSDRPGPSDFRKLALISQALSTKTGGSLIYANGAAEAEKIALINYELTSPISTPEGIKVLIKLVKKTVHGQYALAKVLERGIAFHYGNMPLLIRQEIERLFKEGYITTLVCTSTLLEGVNLPSKSIFIRKPTRGRQRPLSENDFWNLAGRAGRWGKEFSGNIICVEPQTWEVKPNPNKSKQVIRKATTKIEEAPEDFLAFLKADAPRVPAVSRQDLEFAFGYYYQQWLKNELPGGADFRARVSAEFERISARMTLPNTILKRNPGISPLAQQELYDKFVARDSNDLEALLPVFPEDDSADTEYTRLVARIGTTLSDYPQAIQYSRAILLINWMRGLPLSIIIAKTYRYYQTHDKHKHKTLASTIRGCMDDIENFVRFRFANDCSCYIDILRHFLREKGHKDLLARIPDLNLWIEFGVSQQSHLSLLSLGLTRNTVIELSSLIPKTDMSKGQAIEWLIGLDLQTLDISPIMVADISKAVSALSS